MSQANLTIPNSDGSTFRTNVNDALAALASAFSGPTPPSPAYPGMKWLCTETGGEYEANVIYIRNDENTVWNGFYNIKTNQMFPVNTALDNRSLNMLGVWPHLAKKIRNTSINFNNTVFDMTYDGRYLYFMTNDHSYTYNTLIVKLDPISMSEVNTFSSYEQGRCIVSDGTYLYLVSGSYGGKVTKINATNMSLVGSATVSTLEEGYPTKSICDGSYIYMYINMTSPALIKKFDPSTMTVVGSITLASGETGCQDFTFDGRYIYTGLYTTPGKIVKIDPVTMTKVGSTLTLASGENYCRALLFVGNHIYVGVGSTPGKLVKIDPVTMTKVGSTVTLASGENNCSALTYDGTYLYIGTGGGLSLQEGKILRYDPTSMTKVGATITLGANTNVYKFTFDGTYIFTLTADNSKVFVRDTFSAFV